MSLFGESNCQAASGGQRTAARRAVNSERTGRDGRRGAGEPGGSSLGVPAWGLAHGLRSEVGCCVNQELGALVHGSREE